LKGDFTRTGERSILHAMKDGMKSANRYYLRFKDTYRQIAFDVLQGIKLKEEEVNQSALNLKFSPALSPQQINGKSEESVLFLNNTANVSFLSDDLAQTEREQNIKQLVSDCRKQLIANDEDCYGSWALINYNELFSILAFLF
jgi:hypothetical protein